MSLSFSQRQPVPAELLGPLTEATSLIEDPPALRASFSEHGYVLLRNSLDRDALILSSYNALR